MKNRKCKIGWSSCCLLFGAACIILAGVIPVVIDRQIHNGVLDAALLDPSTMTDSALAKFYNGTNYETVYLYNITNLYEVLTAGAIINYEEVGPLVFNRYNNRYVLTQTDARSSEIELLPLTLLLPASWFCLALLLQLQRELGHR